MGRAAGRGLFVVLPHNLQPSPTSLALGHLSQRERLTGVPGRLGFPHNLKPTA